MAERAVDAIAPGGIPSLENAMNEGSEVIASAIARALGCHPSNIPLRVMCGELPRPSRRAKHGFRWRLEDIRRVNSALADALEHKTRIQAAP